MNRNIEFGTMPGRPGEKIREYYSIEGMDYHFPVTIINGEKEGKTVLITAGIHGCEFAGIQTAIELSGELRPEVIAGCVVIIHPVNVSGFVRRVPELLPEAGENLNRLFPGEMDGGFGARMAYHLTHSFQDKADFYLDLHGGDLHEELLPFVFYPGAADKPVTAEAKRVAHVLGVTYMLKSQAVTGAYNSAARRGIPSVLIERGGLGRWSKQEVEAYKKDVLSALSALGVLEAVEQEDKPAPAEVRNPVYLESDYSGCWYPEIAAGAHVKKNQLLGAVKDFFGETLSEYYAQRDGVVLYRTVSLSVSKGMPLVAYAEL